MRFACSSTLALLLLLPSCTGGAVGDPDVGDDGEDEAEDGPTEAEGTEQSNEENNDGESDGESSDGEGSDSQSETADETTDDETADDETETGETGEPCEPFETTEVADCAAIVGEGFCSEGGGHVPEGSEIEWMNNPPHSGKHYPLWETPGEHDDPVERGYWVHNLEHGWIVFAHNCQGNCNAELDVLRTVMEMRPEASILMTPDPLLDGPSFAAMSWTWVHEFDAPDLDELLCFVDQHFDHAPESVH
jgi:hypothetical protein